MDLNKLGWDGFFQEQFKKYKDQGVTAARVVTQHGNYYLLYHRGEYINAELAGKFRYHARVKKDYPAVGDWVIVKMNQYQKVIIQAVLDRKSYLARKLPISGGRKIQNNLIVGGSTEEQIIAANIDFVFIVSGLDGNFNLQRIERYLTITYHSGATPVVILNKADLCQQITEYVAKVKKIAPQVSVHPISVLKDLGMEAFDEYLAANKTVVFVGSSGVGKSTIINYLLDTEKQKTSSVSNLSGKGKHTTTHRELIFHPAGWMIIDTPGMRELQLWSDEKALEDSFLDIRELELKCRFSDCQHDTEPGCAIKQALRDGTLDSNRYASYQKQLKELQILNRKRKEFTKRNRKKQKKK